MGIDEPALKTPEDRIDQLKLTQARLEKQNEETRLASQRALQDAQKQLDALQSNVNQLVQLTTPNAQTITQAAKHKGNAVDAGIGWLNLNQLLESPHKSSYLWAALTLLGILTVVAGLRIQGRKTALAFSTLTPPIAKPAEPVASNGQRHLELPADIAALNLDLNPQTIQAPREFQSPASTKTLQ